MAEMIIGTILAFLAIIGAAELLQNAADGLLRPTRGRAAFLIALSGHEEQTEYLLRSLIFRAQTAPFVGCNPSIIVVDRGMDDETRRICETLADESGCVAICTDSDVPACYL